MAKKNQEVNPEDFVWVLTEFKGVDEENFVGLTGPRGEDFVPVTRDREEAQALLARIPARTEEGWKRQVETIHRDDIIHQANQRGFAVYLVSPEGRIEEVLTGDRL
ncbi:MAG: hypothetical protein KQJ78_21125 [Deltaproteobacteria bacterium]|nr:hypothetical protein [Deltaproteobacteria bacterium]